MDPELPRLDEAELLGALGRADEVELGREEPPELELRGRAALLGGRLVLPLDPICPPGCDGAVRGTMIGREPEELPGDVTGAREPGVRGVKPDEPPVLVLPAMPGVDGVAGRARVTNGLR